MSTAEETKNKFTEKWNLNKIKNLTIEEYSSKGGKNRKDFTYDLEHNTPDIGSIRGGDSSKFKIYMYDKVPTKINILYDEKYAWHKSLGTNCTDAFQKVKNENLRKLVNDNQAHSTVAFVYKWVVLSVYLFSKVVH